MVLRLSIFLFFFKSLAIFGQGLFPIYDQNPASLGFQQIKIPNKYIRIIYLNGADSLAQKTAKYIVRHMDQIGQGFGVNQHSWDIVLQNQGIVSNGFVSLMAPRAEFFSTYSQNASLQATNDWLELLVTHEGRHIFQNEKSRSGISSIFNFFWGRNGQSLYSNLMIPNWLWEGDAVETESKLNPIGRSKIPEFLMPLNAYLLEYGIPKYPKIMGRSYRENVPNHYVFGQFLARNLQAKYGEEFIGDLWKNTLNHPTLFSFSKQIKNISGLTIDKFAENQLKFKLDSLKLLKFNSLATHVSELPKKGYTNYEFPISLSAKEVLAIKSGFSDIPTLVKISPDKEQFLTYLGPLYPSKMLSASSKFVVWSEITFHPRWAQKQSTKLVFYEVASGEKIIWDQHKKYICPSISSDSKYISLLLLNDDGSSELQIFLRETRELVRKKNIGISSQMIQPRITNDGRVVYILLENQNKSLKIWNWDQDVIEFSKEFGNENIASPVLMKNKIYFNRPYQGVDQISSISISSGNQFMETNSPFGAYSVTVDSSITDKITYSQYAASGNRIVSENSMAFDIMPEVPTFKLGSSMESPTFPVTKFSKLNLFNLYAWGPYVNSQNNKIDFSLLSRNVINTLVLGAGYTYDANEKTGTQFVRGSYQAWFPVIDFSVQQGARKTSIYIDKKLPYDSLRTDSWNQTKWDLGFRLPFNLTHSAYQENLTWSSNLSVFQIQGYQLPLRYRTEAFDGTYTAMSHQLTYSKLLTRSLWDVQSKWGFWTQFYWNGMPFKQSLQSDLWAIQSRFYIPGFWKHHGITLKLGYQKDMKGNYTFASPLAFPRGYTYELFEDFLNTGIDYKFPIANTNLNFGRLIYATRFKGNIFMDFGHGNYTTDSILKVKNFQSYGLDLSGIFHFLRFQQPFEVGIRVVFKSQTSQFEFYPLVLDIGF